MFTSNPITISGLVNSSVNITYSGNTTFCAGDSVVLNVNQQGSGYAYQWYRSNISIQGATGSSYIAKQPGTYKLVSKNISNGCSRISSNSINTIVNCRLSNPYLKTEVINDLMGVDNAISLYPNPNNGTFTFEYVGLNEDENEMAVFQIFNATGKLVYQENVMIENGKVYRDFYLKEMVGNGIYLLKLVTNDNSYNSKVIFN